MVPKIYGLENLSLCQIFCKNKICPLKKECVQKPGEYDKSVEKWDQGNLCW